jgi:GNAT superfamily N-acetyltransferase
MIRETEPEETPALLDLARETNVFKPHELVALGEVLNDYHTKERANGHRSITYEQDDRPVGFAYYAPASMTDRGWYLYWIAVRKPNQAKGIGSALMARVEADIRLRRGRMLLVETSSLPHYEPTRQFYLKHGYEQASTLSDFYADGDDLVVFRKRFSSGGSEG